MNRQGDTNDFYDPDAGGESLRVRRLELARRPHEPTRTNYFAVCRIESGAGDVAIDDAIHRYNRGSLLFIVPYQHVRFDPTQPGAVAAIEFHANFLCVETFHAEVGCSGRLFNDPYGIPIVTPDTSADAEIADLFARIDREQSERDLAHEEVALAYLKVLLIRASRLKATDDAACGTGIAGHRHPTLATLGELIEAHYQSWHSPAEYADALHMTAKSLGRLVRESLGTTPTDLIRRRILTHAKWQLLHTLRPVKEIASELGFRDELYFSRLFRKATGVSPTYFREFETAVRGGSNLSMSSSRPSIPSSLHDSDTSSIQVGGTDVIRSGAARRHARRQGHERANGV